jgi:4-diphosphocytidyl-2-C-methyl-D-erythritol kinase
MTRPRIVDGGEGRPGEGGRDAGAGQGPGNGRGQGPGNGYGRRRGDDSGASVAAGGRLHVVRYAPAKLNLTLAVVGRRDDGYHSLHSIMVPLTLGDALTVSTAPAGATHDSLRISGLPLSVRPDNLVLRAIAATRVAVGQSSPGAVETPPLAARLIKRIPMAAGLGGGSSDAAAAMNAALAVWNATLSPAQATAVAASLGSDVPFFLACGVALVTGRGEFVEQLPELQGEPPAVLLVTPRRSISTAAAFDAYGAGARPQPPAGSQPSALAVSENLAAAMRSGLAASGLLELAEELAGANDLLPAAQSVAPDLPNFMRALRKLLGRPVGQSGSGPSFWALYPSLPEARKAARIVRLGVLDGRLPAVGTGEAFVAATSIAVRPGDPPMADHGSTAGRASHSHRPRTVHNGPGESADPSRGPGVEPHAPKGDDSR